MRCTFERNNLLIIFLVYSLKAQFDSLHTAIFQPGLNITPLFWVATDISVADSCYLVFWKNISELGHVTYFYATFKCEYVKLQVFWLIQLIIKVEVCPREKFVTFNTSKCTSEKEI